MRLIKFRGKRSDGKWVYGYYCGGTANPDNEGRSHTIRAIGTQGGYTDYEVDPKTVGQFTGLKDKNGKEIYEGDLFEIVYSNVPNGFKALGEETKYTTVYGEVVMHYGTWSIKRKEPVRGETHYSSLHSFIKNNPKEVIGNKFQKPELDKSNS